MSRLVNLYTDDGRVVVGRTNAPYPVSIITGNGVAGAVITGYTPVQTVIGYKVVRRPGPDLRIPIYGISYSPIYSLGAKTPLSQYGAAQAGLAYNYWASSYRSYYGVSYSGVF